MKKYSFNLEISEELKGFKNHLKELGNSTNTIRQKANYTGFFLNWLDDEKLNELQEYVNETRPKIIRGIYDKTPSRKPKEINKAKLNNQLFISNNGSCCLKSTLLHLFKELQKEKPEVLHAKQIRASVIVNWLKTNNLRQVQYMAGHKYVSSTERYQLDNLENLQKKLEKLHPLSKTQ